MKITICGSITHADDMLAAKKQLEDLGYEVETPDLSEKKQVLIESDEERQKNKDRLMRQHLDKIRHSDAILIFNKDKKGISGYVGGNTLMEMGFAYAQQIEIFMLRDAKEMGYADEIYGVQPIVLHDKLTAITEYFDSLPKTFVSSKSPIKLLAVSRGLRKAGIRTHVLAHPVSSNVAEQPLTIEETYEGAQNRHEQLQKTTPADFTYLVTIESGLHAVHEAHNKFEADIVILERKNEPAKTGITVEIEYPKEMTDKVPSIYPDLGTLVQHEYGTTLKDPFPVFTNGKVERLQFLENAVFTVAAQLK